MISNQILQTTVDGLKAISRVDFCVIDADGKVADNDIMPPQTGNTIYVIAVIMLVLSFGVGIYFYTKKFKNKI